MINNDHPNNNELIPLNILENLTFNHVTINEDAQNNDIDPDYYLVNSLNYKYPSCKYFFPNTPEVQLPTKNSFTLICHNINSLPLHFEEFSEECLCPYASNFDIIGLCETKLTNDIEQLYSIPNYTFITNNFTRNSGGVAMFIKSRYKYLIRYDLTLQHDSTKANNDPIPRICKNMIVPTIKHRFGHSLNYHNRYRSCCLTWPFINAAVL